MGRRWEHVVGRDDPTHRDGRHLIRGCGAEVAIASQNPLRRLTFPVVEHEGEEDIRPQRVQLIREASDDTEVAPAAAQSPQELSIFVVLVASHDDTAVGGDDLRCEQVVTSQAEG